VKRLLEASAVLLALAAGAAGWYTVEASFRTERAYRAVLNEFVAAHDLRVLEDRFVRGWLRSRSTTALESRGGAGVALRAVLAGFGARDPRLRVGIRIEGEIEHGPLALARWAADGLEGAPVVAQVRATLRPDHETQADLADAVGKLPPIQLELEVRSGGHVEARLASPPARLRTSGRGAARTAHWRGLEGELSCAAGCARRAGSLRSAGLEGRGAERAVEIRDLAIGFDLEGRDLPDGRVDLRLGTLRLDPAGGAGARVSIEDLRLEQTSEVARGRFDARLTLRAESLAVGEQRIGPATAVLTLADLDALALAGLRRAAARLPSQAAGWAPGDAAAAADAAGELLSALPRLLARSPRLELAELRLATPQGAIRAQGHVALREPDLADRAPSLASFLEGELEVEAPAAAADALAAPQLPELLASGALVREGDLYRAHLGWRRGLLLAGGAPLRGHPPAPTPEGGAIAGAPPAPAGGERPAAPSAPPADAIGAAPRAPDAPSAAPGSLAAPAVSRAPTPAPSATEPSAQAPSSAPSGPAASAGEPESAAVAPEAPAPPAPAAPAR
jgi:uncharacterized protein YdgA (DUF945 family)